MIGHKKTLVFTRVFKWCPDVYKYRTEILKVIYKNPESRPATQIESLFRF